MLSLAHYSPIIYSVSLMKVTASPLLHIISSVSESAAPLNTVPLKEGVRRGGWGHEVTICSLIMPTKKADGGR